MVSKVMGGGEDFEAQWLHDRLAELVEDLEELGRPGGLIDDVRGRLEFASTIEARSIDDCEEAWGTTVDAIMDSPHYDGLAIEPELGLIPLGAEPDTELFEFAHLQSGEPPSRSGRQLVSDSDP